MITIKRFTRIGLWILFGSFALVALLLIGFFIEVICVIPYQNSCDWERKALAGDPHGARMLSYRYQGFRRFGPPIGRFAPDKKKAVYWLEASAKGGDYYARVQLPQLYEQDFPGMRNSDVVRWYAEGARLGDSSDASRLSAIYTSGQLGQPRDPKKAAYWQTVSEHAIYGKRSSF